MITKIIQVRMTHGKYKGIATRIFLFMLSVSAYSQSDYELSTADFNGPGNDRDIAYSITADNSGLVYVTGQSYGGVYGYDYPTIKYAPNGDTVWVRRYNGTGIGFDFAYALQMDNSSYVYAVGPSNGSSYNYATIRYTPGNTLSGTNILVQLTDSLLVAFDSIEIGGETTVHIKSLGPFPPIGLNLVPSNPPEFYDIRTDVVYSGFIKTCLTYSQEIVNNEPSLLLCRYTHVNQYSLQWDNITILVDTSTNEICGQVPSLSKFILIEPICLGKPGDADANKKYTLGYMVAIVNYIFNKDGGHWSPVSSGACCLPVL